MGHVPAVLASRCSRSAASPRATRRPSFSIQIPDCLSFLATGSLHGQVQGLNELNRQYEAKYGPGNYIPPVEAIYWSMRVMAYAGHASSARRALVGAFLYWRRTLERSRWFLWIGVVASSLPFVAVTPAGC